MSNEEPGQFDRIDHVTVCVASLPAAVKWYTTSFQCSVAYEDKTQAVLQFANIRLTLVLPSQQPPHLAFCRRDAGTLGELQERPDGSRSSYIADPTGNVIEIIEAKE